VQTLGPYGGSNNVSVTVFPGGRYAFYRLMMP
jgi:hypothetical protein